MKTYMATAHAIDKNVEDVTINMTRDYSDSDIQLIHEMIANIVSRLGFSTIRLDMTIDDDNVVITINGVI